MSIKNVVEELIPFDKFLGIKLEKAEKGYARLRLPYRPEFIGDARRPALHGGVISLLADTCGGAAVWASCDVDDRVATIDLRVDYLRPAPPKDIIAEAEVKLLGNRVGNTAIRLFADGEEETTIAEARGVYNIRKVS